MLFNSAEYILVFLPATVLLFLVLGRRSQGWALGWLILASVLFYAWWRPFNLLIIGPSLAVNYLFARALQHIARDPGRDRARILVLAAGIVFNLCVLGYFKYANFAVMVTNDLAGTDFVLERIILPLGISFITFQKIAFLIDVAGRRVEAFSPRDFLLFVMFFPQLIAGPIVHFGETMPQFHRAGCRFDARLYATGLTLFCFGLFKKVVLADGIARYASPVYALAASGGDVTLLQGWLAAVGFTLQIYFDFSGYSDMACGAALFFGVRLPMNFDSPLKATNIIDFWQRWHMTLTRFLNAYVYNPIALALTRRRAVQGRAILTAHDSKVGAYFQVLAFPTLTTMVLSGVWHGAGYTFLLWGGLHGLYLVVNHAWRQYGPRPAGRGAAPARFAGFAGLSLTFLTVVLAMVLFRAPDVAAASRIFEGMAGLSGIGLPGGLAEALNMPWLGSMVPLDGAVALRPLAEGTLYLLCLLAIALLMPNSAQILSAEEPVLYTPKRTSGLFGIGPVLHWRPALPWLALAATLAAVSMLRLSGKSEFLYWQF